MITLFIDTHYMDILLYVFKDNSLLAKKELFNVKNTSVETMPAIIDLLKNSNLTIKNVNKIAVCIGPGSFTGTRIGVTIAKILSYANNIDICTLTSLDLVGLNIDKKSYVAVKEKNGAFLCMYDNGIIGDILYLKNSMYEEFKNNNNVVDNVELNNRKLIDFINNQKCVNNFDVNPLYVKQIEALK